MHNVNLVSSSEIYRVVVTAPKASIVYVLTYGFHLVFLACSYKLNLFNEITVSFIPKFLPRAMLHKQLYIIGDGMKKYHVVSKYLLIKYLIN